MFRNCRADPLACARILVAALVAVAPVLAFGADTPIYSIQGNGSLSPLAGQTVTTTGIVTKVTNNGFFMQDLLGDGNPLSSDGIFVFTSTAPTVTAGQSIRLTGIVAEFNTGSVSNADTLAHKLTELTSPTAITVLSTGVVVTPAVVALPEAVNDDLESYEGMLVTITGPLTVQQNFFQARNGQLTLAAGGRLETPTNRYRPGPQAQALADSNARARILLDDARSNQNPNPTPYLGANGVPRAGDTVASVTGVIDYGLATPSNTGFGDYKIHPTVTPAFTASNARVSTPPSPPVAGNLRVAAMNVLNYFTTFTDGTTAGGQTGQGCTLGASVAASNCRGADSLTEFQRQRAKIVEALVALDGDVVGLMAIQNNGSVAAQNLVDALNALVGAGTYAVVPDPVTGTGTDAIKVAMLYKPARLAPVGTPLSDPAAINNRPPLAQTFAAANNARFTVIVNQLTARGSCPAVSDVDAAGNVDAGDGQACWNLRRVQQAQQLRTFVAQVQPISGSNDVLLVGDFNAYGREDPIDDLAGNGYVDETGRFGTSDYSYIIDGASGRLDYAISSPSMSSKVLFATHWRINADEAVMYDYNVEFRAPALTCGGLCPPDLYQANAFRSSDHDPVLVELQLTPPPLDADGDSIPDATDNCPATANAGQADADGDGRGNACDNCRLVANNTGAGAQCDSDNDGFGNRCDGDLNSNNATNGQDTTLFRQQLGQPSAGPTFNKADLNCNGAVNAQDTTLMRTLLGAPPGPGAGP
jgi:predicted extracellular nuclease